MSGFIQQPFYPHAQPNTNLLTNLLAKNRKKNALLALNNLFAGNTPDQISPEEILTIFNNNKLYPSKDFKDESLKAFYKTFLQFCFDENYLTDEKVDQLKKIKYLLFLGQHSIEKTHYEICNAIYSRDLEAELEDDMLDPKEKTFLKRLYHELQVPNEQVIQIKKFSASQIVARIKNGFVSKNGLSEEEEQLFDILTETLFVPKDSITPSPYFLELLQLLWHCLNIKFPSMNVDINLRSNEYCLVNQPTEWLEEKSDEFKAADDTSLVQKIIYSPYWVINKEDTQPINQENAHRHFTGNIFLTNERLLFHANKKQKIIRLRNIKNFKTYPNGIYILKHRGRNTFLQVDSSPELLSLLLGQALRVLHF